MVIGKIRQKHLRRQYLSYYTKRKSHHLDALSDGDTLLEVIANINSWEPVAADRALRDLKKKIRRQKRMEYGQ